MIRLTETQERVLRFLHASVKEATAAELRAFCGARKRTLDALERKGMLTIRGSLVYDATYFVSAEGKAWLKEAG